MILISDIKVRAKIVLVASKLDPFDEQQEKETSQATVSFNFTEVMSEVAYNQLITELKAGSIAPISGPF